MGQIFKEYVRSELNHMLHHGNYEWFFSTVTPLEKDIIIENVINRYMVLEYRHTQVFVKDDIRGKLDILLADEHYGYTSAKELELNEELYRRFTLPDEETNNDDIYAKLIAMADNNAFMCH